VNGGGANLHIYESAYPKSSKGGELHSIYFKKKNFYSILVEFWLQGEC